MNCNNLATNKLMKMLYCIVISATFAFDVVMNHNFLTSLFGSSTFFYFLDERCQLQTLNEEFVAKYQFFSSFGCSYGCSAVLNSKYIR
jgi:hypothetical protein